MGKEWDVLGLRLGLGLQLGLGLRVGHFVQRVGLSRVRVRVRVRVKSGTF